MQIDPARTQGDPKEGTLMSQLLTKAEVAAYAQCTTRCIDNWMKLGYIPYFKIGRTVRFKVTDIDAYLHEHCRVDLRANSRRFLPTNITTESTVL